MEVVHEVAHGDMMLGLHLFLLSSLHATTSGDLCEASSDEKGEILTRHIWEILELCEDLSDHFLWSLEVASILLPRHVSILEFFDS
jgi:hypothetical protein